MDDREAMAAGMRVESIINPATGKPVKISETSAKAAVGAWGRPDAFIAGYQARLADEWNEEHVKPRQYTVRLRAGEPLESFTAASHSDQGEWVVFYGTDREALMTIKQADVISIWREPIQAEQ